ncbi:MAG: ribonuclease H-like domain-containing protein [Clostridia bacterium]|nr:ribonuclease H-like domain-containing protein [Clostridia bacterium]
MNLRDKLRALDSRKKPAAPPPQRQFTDCWQHEEIREPDDFPGAFEVKRRTVMLMQGEDMPEWFDPRRILYLDTETTGFMGAGTVAFLVGVGWLTDEGFTVRQYLMRDYPEEKYLLERLAEDLERFDVICTFNGRSFDVPLLRDRFLMNRMRPACLDKPHIDLLHIARRVWKMRLGRCNLSRLEEQILGICRVGDIPGAQVPQRFFDYLKTGDFGLLREVISHNAQDIASLCVLLSRMADMYDHPERAAIHSEDVYSMGVALERMKHPEEARRCYRLATGKMKAQGQLRLAVSYRREGDKGQAKEIWQAMVIRREGGVEPYIELAKHYEHVEKDVPAALEMTRRALMMLSEPTLLDSDTVQTTRNAVQYRYERLKRKQSAR